MPSQTGRHALSEFSRQERSEAGIGVVSGPVPPGDGSPPEAATDIRPGAIGQQILCRGLPTCRRHPYPGYQ